MRQLIRVQVPAWAPTSHSRDGGRPDRRLLLGHGEGAETLFRRFVAEAEDAILSTRWVGAPVIVTREEWRQYGLRTGEA